MTQSLHIESVTKSYGERQVLTDVTFSVGAGRMTGFVGANGAGKTTTMRIILGVLGSDSGQVRLGDTRLGPDDRRRFGYMPEERGLYPKMKVAEQLIYLARLHGFTTAAAKRNTAELLERLGLAERHADTVESLSLGNQQRAQIAAALVHEPDVLVLDEPFSGLDPMAVEVVLTVLKDHAAKGAPVLFSSHQLDIVERLCDDVVVIADGQIRASGPRDELRAEHTRPHYELLIDGHLDWLHDVPGITVLEVEPGSARFEAATAADAQHVLEHALRLGPVGGFIPHRPSLAQIFREVIQ